MKELVFKYKQHHCPHCKGVNSLGKAEPPEIGGAFMVQCLICRRPYWLSWLGPWDGIGQKRAAAEMNFAQQVLKNGWQQRKD